MKKNLKTVATIDLIAELQTRDKISFMAIDATNEKDPRCTTKVNAKHKGYLGYAINFFVKTAESAFQKQ